MFEGLTLAGGNALARAGGNALARAGGNALPFVARALLFSAVLLFVFLKLLHHVSNALIALVPSPPLLSSTQDPEVEVNHDGSWVADWAGWDDVADRNG